jgi:EpsI family protein
VTASLGRVPPLPSKRPLSTFPLEFQGWRGNRSQMPPSIWERVGAQDYTIIDYLKKNEGDINFYVAYYQYQRKAGDFIHSPRLCLTGSGWYTEEDRVRRIFDDNRGGPGLQINELLITKNGEKSLVYFWYQGRGRNFTNEFAAKFYLVWDGLFHRRTDGALVRLGMPVKSGKPLADVRMTLDRFALAASEALKDFLPN